jgi:hypothetical protein
MTEEDFRRLNRFKNKYNRAMQDEEKYLSEYPCEELTYDYCPSPPCVKSDDYRRCSSPAVKPHHQDRHEVESIFDAPLDVFIHMTRYLDDTTPVKVSRLFNETILKDECGLEWYKKYVKFVNKKAPHLEPRSKSKGTNWKKEIDNYRKFPYWDKLVQGVETLRLTAPVVRIYFLPVEIGQLTSLRELSLSYNWISDISALSSLTFLEELDLERNEISDISALKKLTHLQKLYLNKNDISDISVLENLTALRSLNLSENMISDISPLKGLTFLNFLFLGKNKISDISVLSELIFLENLHLNDNQISDISALEKLTNIQDLYLNNNQISDISVIKNLINIQTLYLDSNDISDISALEGLPELNDLTLFLNPRIVDFSVLYSLESLSYFYDLKAHLGGYSGINQKAKK